MEVDFPWERAAMRGEPAPPELEAWERPAYQALELVYRCYRRKAITKEEGSAEKSKIKWDLKIASQKMDEKERHYNIDCKYERLHREWKQKTQSFITAYLQTPESETERRLYLADRIVEALDGVPVERSGA